MSAVVARTARRFAWVLLAPAAIAFLAFPVALVVHGPPLGSILHLAILVGAITTLPGLACLWIAIREGSSERVAGADSR